MTEDRQLLAPFEKYEALMVASAVDESVRGMMRAAFIAGLIHGIHLTRSDPSPAATIALLDDVQRLAREMHAEALSYVAPGHA